ncbi:MAG: biotin/lipoyl-binding protein, partial [Micropruina sp.]
MTSLASRVLAGGVSLLLVGWLAGCAPAPVAITVTGKVLDDVVSIQVPALGMPVVNPDAGFAPQGTGAASGSPVRTVTAGFGLGSFVRVAAVQVEVGDLVQPGDPLISLDRAALKAQVVAAKADAQLAAAQVDVLDSAIGDTFEKEADLEDAEESIRAAIVTLTRNRTQLLAKRAQARSQLAILPGKLAGVEAQRRTLSTQLATVKTQLAQASAALAQLPPTAPPEARAE